MQTIDLKIQPYNGGAEPTYKQSNHNTKVLIQELNKLGIKTKCDNGEYANKIWGGKEIMCILIINGKKNHINYDRYGFSCDDELDMDNLPLNNAIDIIVDAIIVDSIDK